MRRLLASLLLAAAACGPSAAPSSAPRHDDAPPATPTPAVREATAPGLCGAWSATPVDLEPIAPLASTAAIRVRGDGRGGFTLHVFANDLSARYVSLSADGAPYADTVEVPPPNATSDARIADAIATSTGWTEAWGAFAQDQLSWLVEKDMTGAIMRQTPPARPFMGWMELAVAPDGRVDWGGSTVDGANAGWVTDDPTAPFEGVYSVPYREGSEAWHDGIFFALDGATLHTLDAAGNVLHIPTSARAMLLGATDPHHAVAVAGPIPGAAYAPATSPAPGATATVWFLGDDTLDSAFTLDAEVDVLAAAARDASHGALLLWTSDGLTAEGGVAFGLAEVAPGGARGPIVSLGNQIVNAQTLTVDASGDGTSYLVIETNVALRQSFVLRCAG